MPRPNTLDPWEDLHPDPEFIFAADSCDVSQMPVSQSGFLI